MISDKNTLVTMIEPGRHAMMHGEKYFAKGQAMLVGLCFGAEPLLVSIVASILVPYGISEYAYAWRTKGEPIEVIEGEMTGYCSFLD